MQNAASMIEGSAAADNRDDDDDERVSFDADPTQSKIRTRRAVDDDDK